MSESLAHRLYDSCPVFVQNMACSLVGLKIKWERYNRHFGRYLRWLHETERWSADRIHAHQDENLRRIVRWAYESVPFYKKWYDEHGVHPDAIHGQDDLHRLPILTNDSWRAMLSESIDRAIQRYCDWPSFIRTAADSPLRHCWTSRQWHPAS